MTGHKFSQAPITLLFAILLFSALTCGTAALADDEELLTLLPGPWTFSDYVDDDDPDDPLTVNLGVLTLVEDGTMSLCCNTASGEAACTYEGTWAFELVPDQVDRLTLLYTATDDPRFADADFRAECVYDVYAESWVEDVTRYTYLILTETECSGFSPLDVMTGEEDGTALHRDEGPNMQVVNCKNYVSLRESRSAKSARLAKVPLGALVFVFPEVPEKDGFLWCVYNDEYGYILSEYLQEIE